MNEEYYKENFKGKIYDYDKIESDDNGDTLPNMIMEKFMKKSVGEMFTVKFAWKIYDSSVGLPAIAYGGPNWHYEIYGVKQDRKTIK